MTLTKTIFRAAIRMFRDSGISLASAVAFSFLLSIFPFFVFLSSVFAFFGWGEHLASGIEQFFLLFPDDVKNLLWPEIAKALVTSRVELLTIGGLMMLFFASAGVESLRGALNRAYDDEEHRSAFWLRLQSVFFIIESAAMIGLLGCFAFYAPEAAQIIAPHLGYQIGEAAIASQIGYGAIIVLIALQLYIFHAFLPAGKRKARDIWPGIFVSIPLWLVFAALFSVYVAFSNFNELYAGLSQVVIALVFFQLTAAIVIFGAEYNRVRIIAREGTIEQDRSMR